MQRILLSKVLCALLAAGEGFAGEMPSGADAERDRESWEKVREIGPDKQIEVEIEASTSPSGIRSCRGRLVKWAPDGLVLSLERGESQLIGKALVQSVWVIGRRSRRKTAAIGGAIGFGIGTAVGIATFERLDSHGTAGEKIGFGALIGLAWGGAGALIGTAFGGATKTNVYRR